MIEYQYYHNDEHEFLWKLLADPVNNTHLYAYNLQRLVNDNPQSGIFRALLARTGGEENFRLASVHFNSRSLYKLINYPLGFEKVTADKIILDPHIPSRPVVEKPAFSEGTDLQQEQVANNNENILAQSPAEVAETNQPSAQPEYANVSDKLMEVSMAAEYDLSTGYSVTEPGVFGADVSIEQLKEDLKNIKTGKGKLIAAENNRDNSGALTYYHEVIPYSFMWWLDKTRKERAESFQPYAKARPARVPGRLQKKNTDELQHQYVENIFHLTAVEELDKNTAHRPENFDLNRKDNRIIERFLEKDPQIKPLQAEMLDTENKAKESAEDTNEIVTETLAAIYAEQMLYQKSIAAYKKLMLKFPEKSRYFADKIEQLEKKTNL